MHEKKRIRAEMRLTGLRRDAISKSVEFRNEMGDRELLLVERELKH
jgi:hypothetical protein